MTPETEKALVGVVADMVRIVEGIVPEIRSVELGQWMRRAREALQQATDDRRGADALRCRVRHMTRDALLFIVSDTTEAIRAFPDADNVNLERYMAERSAARCELSRRDLVRNLRARVWAACVDPLSGKTRWQRREIARRPRLIHLWPIEKNDFQSAAFHLGWMRLQKRKERRNRWI